MHCVVYTGIVPIVICILYQVYTDLQSGKGYTGTAAERINPFSDKCCTSDSTFVPKSIGEMVDR